MACIISWNWELKLYWGLFQCQMMKIILSILSVNKVAVKLKLSLEIWNVNLGVMYIKDNVRNIVNACNKLRLNLSCFGYIYWAMKGENGSTDCKSIASANEMQEACWVLEALG